MRKHTLSIRAKVYRDEDGLLICGTSPKGTHISVFTRSRHAAEQIKARIVDGQQWTHDEWKAWETA